MLTCFGRNISPSSGGCVDLTRFFLVTAARRAAAAVAAVALMLLRAGGPYSLTHELGCMRIRGCQIDNFLFQRDLNF